ncbi:hypothetical protein SERLA73DRAFT_79740 [Serpula lacrymans var. lacrymans S7.3]|uniref:Retrotransposon gag domain-containing protein n=1 Tax=Serpula lacrymans var. lacrymans (strain S7.3) TaxID=936435 RepID=F8QHE8_SERL3|nr:hypothetical protein SERLA73DRAFT_79740 [Serpula lacrymans var. lacrymans S7.3]
MSSQPDMNSLLHNMRAQIQALTNQLAKIQAAPAVEPTVEQKFNKKVEILQIWIKVNWDAFADDFEIAMAVLSRLKGPVAGRYAQVRMQECYTAGVWPTWDDLKVEIEKYFKPQAERDWVRQQIRSFKQGNMRMDDFVTRFLALSIQGGLGNEHAVELLERNVSLAVAQQLYIQDMQSENLAAAAEEVQKIGRAIELYDMQFSGRSTTKNNVSQRRPGSSNQYNHSHGFKLFGLQPGQGAPMDIGTPRGTHVPRLQKWVAGRPTKKNQGHQAHQLETEKPDDRLQTLAGRSYDEIRAFFYDQQVAEMNVQGKEFGA